MAERRRRGFGRFCALLALWFLCAFVPLAALWWILDETVARWAEWHLWLVAGTGLVIAVAAGIVHRSWLMGVILLVCGVALYAAIATVVFLDIMSGGGPY